MAQEQHFEQFVQFFKVLGEPRRLRIVGLLAAKPRTVEQVAELLGVGASTVSHHLSRLADAGLVSARSESYYSVYSLKTDALTSMAKELLKQAEQQRPPEESALNDFDRKVLGTFTTPEGRITSFPAGEKRFQVLLRHVVRGFEPGVRYTEKRVNQILANYNEDTARLRRGLVDYRLMAREGGGGKYWRT